MMVITRTPFRVSLLGGGTDYYEWIERSKRGATLGFALNKYCYVLARETPDAYHFKHKVVYSQLEMVQNTSEISHPLVREYLKFLNWKGGLEIHYWADMPAMKGMGTSSAFAVGLILALSPYSDKWQLGQGAYHLERELAQQYGGYQDSYLCAYGGCNFLTFGRAEIFPAITMPTINVEPLPIWPFEMANYFLLFDTGLHRRASDISKSYTFHEKTLNRMTELAYEGKAALLSKEWSVLGQMLHEAWCLKRELSPRITNDTIDEIYSEGLRAGAIGGKLLGAGAGGYMLFMAEPQKHDAIKKALWRLKYVPVGIDTEGAKVILRE